MQASKMQLPTTSRALPVSSIRKPSRLVAAASAGRHGGPQPAACLQLGVLATSLLLSATPVSATGLESVDILPKLQQIQTSEDFKSNANKESQKLEGVEEGFQKSDTLKRLLEQSAANKEKNQRAIQNKYCYRQAEIGVGDCGGLRYIPGMTENGKQRTPDWLAKALGMDPQPEDTNAKTLKDLFGEDFQKP
ncbi:hypothetical protein DUNSADRAFT_18456 [Dunaliella salina]|uniref:Uncharacterized protein n=1 Tax=Dunaliella salina TaxID=3046 RepID=A0ABQ7G087_DUNSA|nr:hypothetical protein DUNSADRAFT_18456 [Dunaliella salina]|eukprot:KAF5827960.1 hypothetical protein DUNSADRAFT_18456 [Dunaliella salina]